MKKFLFLMTALGLVCSAGLAYAADGAPTPQQNRMAACNKEAVGKTGDDRKAFMKQCLSTKKLSQQEKMKACNHDAGSRKGDERKAFMKDCLSK